MLAAGLLQGFPGPQSDLAARGAHVDDQHRAVGLARQDAGVGHGQDGRRVQDHDVGEDAQLAQQLRHARRGQQLRRVGRRHPGGDHPQVRHVRELEVGLVQRAAAQQQGTQAVAAVHLEQAADRRSTQVGVHQDHALAGLGHHDGQVGRGGRLALAGPGAGHHQAARGRVLAQAHVLQVGAQRAVALAYVETGGPARSPGRPSCPSRSGCGRCCRSWSAPAPRSRPRRT